MAKNRGIQTDMFICDQCGNRQRLPKAQRHWCELCTHGSPVEMRLTRGKLHRPSTAASHLPPPLTRAAAN
jgi:hypothetical protein